MPVEEVDQQIRSSVNYWARKNRSITGAWDGEAIGAVWIAILEADRRGGFDGQNPGGYIHAVARNAASNQRPDGYLTNDELVMADIVSRTAGRMRPSSSKEWGDIYDEATKGVVRRKGWKSNRERVIYQARTVSIGGASAIRGHGEQRPLLDSDSIDYQQPGLDRSGPEPEVKGEVWRYLAPDVRPVQEDSIPGRRASKYRKAVNAAGGPVPIARRLLDRPADDDAANALCAPWGDITRAEQEDIAAVLVRHPALAEKMWQVAMRIAERRPK